jgi:hypothetical protein
VHEILPTAGELTESITNLDAPRNPSGLPTRAFAGYKNPRRNPFSDDNLEESAEDDDHRLGVLSPTAPAMSE